MINDFPRDFVSRLEKGRVRAIGTPEPISLLAQLQDCIEQSFPTIRAVGIRLNEFSSHDDLLRNCVEGLASAAIALWPDWYGADVTAGQGAQVPRSASQIWRAKAEPLAAAGRLPLPEGYPDAFHVAQLDMALSRTELLIALAIGQSFVPKGLQSLVAAAKWLAGEASAKVALIVPDAALLSPEFDRVSKELLLKVDTALPEAVSEELPAVTITSIRGRPNPTSPGEMLLARELSKNVELSSLFNFNRIVRSIHAKEYRVDLVWPEGKLVVEVDGYTFHRSQFAFGEDRHRDYELLISGYRVLRLTHDEIMKDTQRAVAKIRDSVHFIKENPSHGV
jgi:very-short-patch-repair endonuclease